MRYGGEQLINKNWNDEQIARAKERALHRLAQAAQQPIAAIAPLIQESRRETDSGDWWYQVRVEIRSPAILLTDPDDIRRFTH